MQNWKSILLFVMLLVSCSPSNQPQLSKEIEFRCAQYYTTGDFGYSDYYFCGIVPVIQSYSYKTGIWKFWNLSGQLIAKGEFDNPEIEINDHGGCSYKVIQNKIIPTQWKFWDDNGAQISAGEKLIKTLEECSVIRQIRN